MLRSRYIPCLLLHEGGLVKSEKFNKAKYIGDPINAVKIFNDKEVDEIIFLDIDATKVGKEPDFEMLSDLVTECFMPFSYGGGINSLKQIEKLLKIGIEKVIINNAALCGDQLLIDAVRCFGSSTIVGGIDVKKNFFGKKLVYNHKTKKVLDLDPLDLAIRYCNLGVGEVFLNSVDLDGTFNGYDLELISKVSKQIEVPLIASGGASSINNLREAILSGASAAAAGSLFVFQGPHKAVLISYPISE